MIKVIGSIPKVVSVAVSGGADSMAALDFLRRGNRDIRVLYFNHNTPFSDRAQAFVESFCKRHSLELNVGKVSRLKDKGESQEEYWRKERYSFFDNFNDTKIITCHHLDDAVETWVFTSLHGNPCLIPYSRDHFIRPFLTTRKEDFLNWCERKSVPYLEDPSNNDKAYMRNFIRHDLLKKALVVNPGLHKVIKKKTNLMFKESIDRN